VVISHPYQKDIIAAVTMANPTAAPGTHSLDVFIPVYNEERDLRPSVLKLREFLKSSCPYKWRILVANNASTDKTLDIAKQLKAEFPGEVDYIHLDQKGRGRALRKAWTESNADVSCYMDVDLSTNLKHLMPMVDPLFKGEFQIGIGNRLMRGARVKRQFKREVISRIYNVIVKVMFPGRRFTDAQCGFKAITRQAAKDLLPHIQDNRWFFDSELLLRAEQQGYKIWQVPVEWVEDLDTRVKIASTAVEDLQGLWRVRTTKFRE